MTGPARPDAGGVQAPYSTGTQPPAFPVPPGACDCHMHFFDHRLPFAPGPVLRHADATPADYRRLQRRLGLARHVVVQPSSYGRDHRVLLQGLQASEGRARGIAVVDPAATGPELDLLQRHGVVGVRFNLVQSGATDEGMLERVAALVRPRGWHIQLHLPPARLVGLAERLAALPVPVVIDHFARANAEPALAGRIADTVDTLMATGRVWMKLSAPYIASPGSADPGALDRFVGRLAARHPDRLVWGSDWPHVTEADKPDDAGMLDLLARWFDPDGLRRVLVDNPEHLYGFRA